MTMKEELIEKIKNRTLTMGVCGLGYVGLPLAVDKAKHGFHTIGFDVQQEKVDMVNAGKNYIGDVVNSDLEELVSRHQLCPGFHDCHCQASDPGLHRGAGVHHLSRHH